MFGFLKKKVKTDGTRKFDMLVKLLNNEDVLSVFMSGTNQCPLHLVDDVKQAVVLTRYLATLTGLSADQVISSTINSKDHKSIVSIIINKENDENSDQSNSDEWINNLIIWANESRIDQYKVGDSRCPGTGFPRDKNKIKSLDFLHLSNSNINSLPPDLGKMEYLTQIYLDDNNIDSYPKELCYYKNLYRLDIDGNNLTELPREILNLSSLQSLSLRGNNITHLPIEMTKLTNLNKIDLREQPIPLGSVDSPLSDEGFEVLNYFNDIVKI